MKFQDQYYVQMDADCRLINCSVDKTAIQPSGKLVGIHKLSNRFYKQIISEYAKVVEEKPKLGYVNEILPPHPIKKPIDGFFPQNLSPPPKNISQKFFPQTPPLS